MKIEENKLLIMAWPLSTDSVKMAQVVPDICPREKEFAGMMKQLRDDLVRVAHGNLENIPLYYFVAQEPSILIYV